jgi:hypothetical protein
VRALIRPSERIWAMLSGYPSAARRRRLMVMLQAYVDDSGRGQRVFVLAGFIASPATWAVFSDEWAAVLATEPHIDYFKMMEAHNFKKQFDGWESRQRDKKISDLYDVIQKHELIGIRLCINMDEYDSLFASIEHDAPHYFYVYVLAVSNIVSMLARYQKDIGLHEKVDFIFDHQPGQSGKIIDVWDFFKEIATDDTKDMLGSLPEFKDDKDTMPLQAADLHAWWARRRQLEKVNGEPRLDWPCRPMRDLQCLALEFTRAQLEQARDMIMERIKASIPSTYGGATYRQF